VPYPSAPQTWQPAQPAKSGSNIGFRIGAAVIAIVVVVAIRIGFRLLLH
jgi:hypothetical protein